MNLQQIKEDVNRLMSIFPTSFINRNFELIIEPKNNIYFNLSNVMTGQELDLKVVAWLSRPSCKGVSVYWQNKIRNGFNQYFNKDYSKEDMDKIYTRFGNGCNEAYCTEWIISGMNIDDLKD